MSKKQIPSVTVDASIKQDRKPIWIDIGVVIKGSGPDRVSAYTDFDKILQKYKLVVDGLGDLVIESKVTPPHEESEEVERTFKKSEIVHVRATATVRIGTSATMGATLTALLDGGFVFEQPQFVYPEVPEIQPDQLESAAVSARLKAEACARGAGCQLGEVLSITFPRAKENLLWKPMTKMVDFTQVYSRTDLFLMENVDTNVPSYEDEFTVIITYELVSV